ncbi:tRNA (adenosine(37)-N6)-dimethylallyltransferase MiaA [[Flexibacter] sp. ATCC 35208]|uniref:tRNA (adenosine(37)-N6)-dimethylallyltransferase MiaA n=1 Tax=[Flexibacter] sp. ATCC 35208 TaxID=1936242 RepID=UPI0009CC68C9|nr:tRNA (adenosine(37)-N6)-dimethylallyltransferase MiaA [[Flexibacter] sp. ATCC 35208]OMP77093.1 tRNA (adenosine(37)-N6)-dimethylallyltransferase MiaA [[Flexibacter] sp. ATCC 35208]
MRDKKVIVIAGPTAAGKTAMAVRVAQYFNTAVISADSRQCYREISIGTAKPGAAELAAVPHYFINSHSIREEVNAGIFEKLALQYAEEVWRNNDVVVLCGGTGLYIKAFCEGIDDIPAAPTEVRQSIISQYVQEGLTWLQEEVKAKDPGFYAVGEIQNPQRLMRALEVFETTGKSILEFRTGNKTNRDFEIIKTGIELEKPQLHANIETRVRQMMKDGLVEEVRSVQEFRSHNALQTVGYSEIFDYLDGKTTLQEAEELVVIHTRQYAKRQMTWFKKDKEIKWYERGEGLLEDIKKTLGP